MFFGREEEDVYEKKINEEKMRSNELIKDINEEKRRFNKLMGKSGGEIMTSVWEVIQM